MSFKRHFLAGIAGGEIDFAEPAMADAALDGVARKRPRTAGVGEPRTAGDRRLDDRWPWRTAGGIRGTFVRLRGVEVHGRNGAGISISAGGKTNYYRKKQPRLLIARH